MAEENASHPDDVVYDQRNYRPGPCRSCGEPVIVTGFTEDRRGGQSTYKPNRRCTNSACITRTDRIATPSP